VCDAVSSVSSGVSKDRKVRSKRHRVHILQDVSSAVLLLQETAYASLNV
jgi:hypothetical protein